MYRLSIAILNPMPAGYRGGAASPRVGSRGRPMAAVSHRVLPRVASTLSMEGGAARGRGLGERGSWSPVRNVFRGTAAPRRCPVDRGLIRI